MRDHALDLALQLGDRELYDYVYNFKYKTLRNLERRIAPMEEELKRRFDAVNSVNIKHSGDC